MEAIKIVMKVPFVIGDDRLRSLRLLRSQPANVHLFLDSSLVVLIPSFSIPFNSVRANAALAIIARKLSHKFHYDMKRGFGDFHVSRFTLLDNSDFELVDPARSPLPELLADIVPQ